jgi:hypothetical protein
LIQTYAKKECIKEEQKAHIIAVEEERNSENLRNLKSKHT